MDFDWDEEAAFKGAFVYIAMSDGLQEWAFHNDRLHLVKIGYSRDPQDRLAYLNGERLWDAKRVRPCLNFTDWRIIGRWPVPSRRSAWKTEERLKDVFAKVFERFDRTEIVRSYPVGNGETEIYRLPLRHLPVLPGLFRAHGVEGHIVSQAVTVVETAVEEIGRQWANRLSRLDCDNDPPEPTSVCSSEATYRDTVEQMQEDMTAYMRARDDGWPYDDR